MKNLFYFKILPKIIYIFYTTYMKTVKFLYNTKKPNYLCIYAHFHQDELILINAARNYNYCVMTSYSKDGELMTQFLKKMGYFCVRGSSSKKAISGFLALLSFAKSKKNSIVLAVDGPKGPIYKVKKGVILLSKLSGLPIVPLVAKPYSYYTLNKSWNKALIPKLFSKVNICIGKPIYIDKEEKNLDFYKELIEKELKTLKNIN
jgi:lysophospholipid acyltransferase (LPLAT)-like uncharacterized protein